MARGVSGDFEDFTGLYLGDYPFEDLMSDDDWFADYPEVELWVTVSAFAVLAGGVA
jgi:hypothetical protein